MLQYHDEEWGVPVWDDRRLFESLILEGAQAGLSWQTILRKRDGYRAAFTNFDPEVVANFGDGDVARLLANPEIVRNRQKISAAIGNAQAFLKVIRERESFAAFIWSFVNGAPMDNSVSDSAAIPATSRESEAMSRELRQLGLPLRGPHHLLRVHAVRRAGQRPPNLLLPLPGNSGHEPGLTNAFHPHGPSCFYSKGNCIKGI